MNDFDRYDLALSLLNGLVAIAALMLATPLWVVVIIMPVGLTISLFRHLDLTPAKLRRAEAEYRARAAAQDPRSGRPAA